MRILFLTNFYPPHELGGQGQSCQQVVEGLRKRGHATLVLTSMHGTNNLPSDEFGIHRWLYLEMDLVPRQHGLVFFTKRKVREQLSLDRLEALVDQFNPDIIFIWGMWNLPRSLPALAEARCPGKVVYRFAEYWPTLPSQHEMYWRTPGRNLLSRLPKKLLGRIALYVLARENHHIPLRFEHAICVSSATRRILVDAGIPIAAARIIHTGIDTQKYIYRPTQHHSDDSRQTTRLLYAGRLAADKGVETAINAMHELISERGLENLRLDIAGSGSTDYEDHLRFLVAKANLEDYISFLGWVPPKEMPGMLQNHEILVVPSVWPEPLSRMILEGMISGLVVVATRTGGSPEVIKSGENGLLFASGDAKDMARKVVALSADPELRRKLARVGQQTVRERFNYIKMLDEIEAYLQEVTLGGMKAQTGQLAEL
jgi:glycogen(starch) synthase